MDAVNPLMMSTTDLVWSGLSLAAFVVAVWGVVSLSRNARRMSSLMVLVWTLVILMVPVLGPIAWLAAGSRAGAART